MTPEDFEYILTIARKYDVSEFIVTNPGTDGRGGSCTVTFLPKLAPAVKERKEPPPQKTALDVALEGMPVSGELDRVEFPEGIGQAPRQAGVQWADDEPPANKPQE